MIDAVRSEWRKVFATRSLVVLLVCTIACTVGLAVLVAVVVDLASLEDGAGDPRDRSVLLVGGMGIARFLLGSLGVLVIGQEFRFSTIRVTFAAEPRRGRVLLAKGIVTAVVTALTAAIALAVAVGLGAIILGARGWPVELADATVLRSLAGWVVTGAVFALAGLALGMLLRQPVGGIVVLVAWRMLVEPVIAGFFPDIGGWLPFTAGDRVLSLAGDDAAGPAGWLGFAYVCAVVTVLAAAGARAVVRRDA